jgi:transcriptional regulator PpsR
LRALNIERESAGANDFLSLLDPRDRSAVQAMLERVRERGKTPSIVLHLGKQRVSWMVRATLVAAEPWPVFVLQLTPVGGALPASRHDDVPPIDGLMEQYPDGFVVFDQSGTILRVNQAFLDLIQVGSKVTVVGEKLSRWLWRPGADVAVLLSHVNRSQFVRMFSTVIHSEIGTETEVEISAAGDRETDPRAIAAGLRDVSRRLTAPTGSDALHAMLTSISEQVGKTPLRKLVRNTVSVVEQHYIKAALELSENNRTAAAEILGLSRQSLYAKLNRYGLEGEMDAVENKDG